VRSFRPITDLRSTWSQRLTDLNEVIAGLGSATASQDDFNTR
jgi:hypothetical protein